jgi:hypothetical protein
LATSDPGDGTRLDTDERVGYSTASLAYYFDEDPHNFPEFLKAWKRSRVRFFAYGTESLHVGGTVSHRSEAVNRYFESHLKQAIEAGIDAHWLKAHSGRLRAYVSLKEEGSSTDIEFDTLVLRIMADAGATLLVDSL